MGRHFRKLLMGSSFLVLISVELFVQCVFRQPETRVVALLADGVVVHGSLEP